MNVNLSGKLLCRFQTVSLRGEQPSVSVVNKLLTQLTTGGADSEAIYHDFNAKDAKEYSKRKAKKLKESFPLRPLRLDL